MIVTFRGIESTNLGPLEARYVSPSQLFLSSGKSYEVHALSVYDGVCFLLVVDDLSTPDFKPRVLFDVVDPRIPGDWICNTFPTGPVQVVIGPTFIAQDLTSYNGMIDQRMEPVTAFWDRLESRKTSS